MAEYKHCHKPDMQVPITDNFEEFVLRKNSGVSALSIETLALLTSPIGASNSHRSLPLGISCDASERYAIEGD
jgi:hypothetical protein